MGRRHVRLKWTTRVSDKLFLGCVWVAVSLAYPVCCALDYRRAHHGARSDVSSDRAGPLRRDYWHLKLPGK